jgi:Restriction endonuclease.
MINEPAWRAYEREVHAEVATRYRDAVVTHDVKLAGHRSGVPRQIDILVEERAPSGTVTTVIDAKHHGRKIDVKEVEAFIGLLHDIGICRGIMISSTGYTPAALQRAFRDDVDVDLDVFSLAEFRQFQSHGAIIYAGRNGAILSAPLGWAVDGERFPDVLARIYRRGRSFEEAYSQMEFMYVNLWDRQPPVSTLEALLEQQRSDILSVSPEATIHLRELSSRSGPRACIRRAELPEYPTAEITGFVEFENFIFFAVLFTPLVVERRNVRKLEYVLENVLPMSVRTAA